MSASVATPFTGLRAHDMPDFTATDFDHMEIDRQNKTSTTTSPLSQQKSNGPTERTPEEEQDHNRAVGNLLAALSSQPPNHSDDVSKRAVDETVQTLSEQAPSTEISEQAFEFGLGPNSNPLPAWDAPATGGLPSNVELPSLLETDLSQSFMDLGASAPQLSANGFANDDFGAPFAQPLTPGSKSRMRDEFQAFAKLVFQDGNFYLNTYAIELGRDMHAWHAAQIRLDEEKKAGRFGLPAPAVSHLRSRQSGVSGSQQIQNSIVSEAGGFAGIDSNMGHQDERKQGHESVHKSSHSSAESDTIQPHKVLMDPNRLPHFDYNRRLIEHEIELGKLPPDYEEPAAVTADHMPDPNVMPLLPIHGTMQTAEADVEGHRAISRRHVRIVWSFEKDIWELVILGRNGAFLNKKYYAQGRILPIEHGSIIQISHVEVRFYLPSPPPKEPPASGLAQPDPTDAAIDADAAVPSIEHRPSDTSVLDFDDVPGQEPKSATKVNLKTPVQAPLLHPDGSVILGPDGKPVFRKRGPGRPPKNGIMSNREQKERERAKKQEEAKAANGGVTPPPQFKSKPAKPLSETPTDDKAEKRKYKKRKRVDENGQPLASMDDEDSEVAEEEEPKTKKARTQREKSESPEYPAKEDLTQEQLARPADPYATLLWKLLMEHYPEALALKQIYRLMKQKWPYFVHEVGTEGWQSSVRHNLNSEYQKLFEKGDKEGKGYAWKAKPDAVLPQQDRKKTATQPAQPKPRPGPPKPAFHPGNGQHIHQWQNHTAYPPQGSPQGFVNGSGQWQPNNPQPQPWPQQGQMPSQPLGLAPGQVPAGLLGPQSQTPQPPNTAMIQATPNNNSQVQPSPASNVPVASGVPLTNGAAPIVSSGGFAPSNMPCTWAGVEAIKNFEREMYKTVEKSNPTRKEFWQAAFRSAQIRCLHGHAESLTGGETSKEERILMTHINAFIKNFRNPNFKGFTSKTQAAPPASNETQEQPPASDNTQAGAVVEPRTSRDESEQDGGTRHAGTTDTLQVQPASVPVVSNPETTSSLPSGNDTSVAAPNAASPATMTTDVATPAAAADIKQEDSPASTIK